jgi:hypothetical protein
MSQKRYMIEFLRLLTFEIMEVKQDFLESEDLDSMKIFYRNAGNRICPVE